MILSAGARQETSLIFALISLFFISLWSVKKKNFIVFLSVITAILIGQLYTATPTSQNKDVKVGVDSNAPNSTVENSFDLNVEVLKAKVADHGKTLLNLPGQRNTNALNAQSSLEPSLCTDRQDELYTQLQCNLRDLPSQAFSVLFRPFPFIEMGSKSYRLAGIENLFWTIIVIYVFFILITNRKYSFSLFLLISYLLTYVVAMALYEGNLGTAFRHKSSIWWTLLLIIFQVRLLVCRPSFVRRDFRLRNRQKKYSDGEKPK
jgi:hypothetical protein